MKANTNRFFPLAQLIDSNGIAAGFAGTDADGVFNGRNEYFAITDFSGVGTFNDGFGHGGCVFIVDDDFQFHLGEKIHGVFTATVNLGMAFLAAESFDFRNGHSLNADFGESFLHFFKFEGFNNGFDFFHDGQWRLVYLP